MRKFTDNLYLWATIIALTLAVVAQYDRARDNAAETLAREGYTNIDLGYYGLIGCTKEENLNIPFTATKNGSVVSGQVCSSFFTVSGVIRF